MEGLMFKNVDIAAIILQNYIDSWFIWVGAGIVGLLLVIFAEKISFSKREINKKISFGSSLIGLTVAIHLGVSWALFN